MSVRRRHLPFCNRQRASYNHPTTCAMLKFYFICCALLLAGLCARAQDADERQFQFNFRNHQADWVPLNDSVYYGCFYGGFDTLTLLHWDARHNQISWKKHLPMGDSIHSVRLLVQPDGSAVLAVRVNPCDVAFTFWLLRVDAQGQEMWKELYTDCRFSGNGWLFPVQHQPDQFYFFTQQCRRRMRTDGSVLEVHDFDREYRRVLPDGKGEHFLIPGFSNLVWHTRPDGSLATYSLPGGGEPLDALPMPDGGWLWLSQHVLVRVDTAFNPVQQNFLGGTLRMERFQQTHNRLWIIGRHSSNEESFIGVLDTQQMTLSQVSFFNKAYELRRVLTDPATPAKTVWLSGHAYADLNQRLFAARTPIGTPEVKPTRSLALTDVRIEGKPLRYPPIPIQLCNPWWPRAYPVHFGKVFVTLRNVGLVPIEHFTINGGSEACNLHICLRPYLNLIYPVQQTILPGESVEILLADTLILQTLGESLDFSLCFWAAMPDERLDANPADDRLCRLWSVAVLTAEPTGPSSYGLQLRPAPHPVPDATVFRLLNAPEGADLRGHFSILDAMGRTVFVQPWSGEQLRWQRGTLPPGLYLYQLALESGETLTGRLALE